MDREIKKPLLERGTMLNDKWEILAHIATGGAGEVYRARQKSLDRDVAVKILSPEFLTSLEHDEEELQTEAARFQREVKAMAQVNHPHVLQVFDYDRAEVEGHLLEYIAMEYVPGSTLRRTMPEKGFQENEDDLRKWIRSYFLPVLDGVEAVHRFGIIHRDLKPENVLLDGDIPKISDFGLAGSVHWQPITRSHHALGTIGYMASEQFSDMDLADVRADVYSLGKILYEAVTGKMGRKNAHPFQGVSLPDPKTAFFERLNSIIQSATSKELVARTSSVKELSRSLEELVNRSDSTEISGNEKVPAPAISRRARVYVPTAFAALLVVILLAGIWYHFKTPSSQTQTGQRGSPVSVSDTAPVKREEAIQIQGPGKPGDVYEGKDGATLRFVPGGEFRLKDAAAAEGGMAIIVQPFYMDKDEVTNHQYVEFLNKNISNIQIQGRTVNKNGEIWLFLGEIREGYEPIVFRAGFFRVKDPSLASHPVVRATAYGAEAYARFYGRQLPSVNEWIHAAGVGHLFSDISKNQVTDTRSARSDTSTSSSSHSSMHNSSVTPSDTSSSPLPVGQAEPNGYGLTGLRGNVREWVVNPAARKAEDSYYIMGEFDEQGIEPSSRPIARYPWEAFRDVGFRTIMRIR